MTSSAVQMLFRQPIAQEFGVVLECLKSGVRVRVPDGEKTVGIAASCLVVPRTGDRVLVVHGGEEAYVLAVLKRGAEETELAFEGGVSFRVPNGKLRVSADRGVEVSSPEAVRLRADEVETNAQTLKTTFSSLEMVGQSISTSTTRLRVVAEAFDTVAGRIYQRAMNFLRRTDEIDRVEAKHIDRRAEHLVHTHGENAITTAEHLVKINAGQVQIG